MMLKNQVAVIYGAGGGIGGAISRAFDVPCHSLEEVASITGASEAAAKSALRRGVSVCASLPVNPPTSRCRCCRM
jgi:hypothetical protein